MSEEYVGEMPFQLADIEGPLVAVWPRLVMLLSSTTMEGKSRARSRALKGGAEQRFFLCGFRLMLLLFKRRGPVSDLRQQLLLPPASPQACPAHFCHLLPDGARRLQPVDVERPVIEGRSSNGVSVDKDAKRDAGEELLIAEGDADEGLPWEEARRARKARDPGAPSVIGKPTKPLTSCSVFGVRSARSPGQSSS